MTSTVNTQDLSSGSVLLTIMKLRTFIALIAVLVFFSFAAPNFLSTANWILMSKHVALNAFLAMGMTFVIITGGIDLSVGSIVGLCGMVAGGLILNGVDLGIGYTVYFNIYEICLITLLVGILIGAVNGLLITKLNVAPFIATLGTLYVARGLSLLSSDGRTFPNLVGREEFMTTGFGMLGLRAILWLAHLDLAPDHRGLGRCLHSTLNANWTPHICGWRQRKSGPHLRSAGQHGENVRLHVFRFLCRHSWSYHFIRAHGVPPGHG